LGRGTLLTGGTEERWERGGSMGSGEPISCSRREISPAPVGKVVQVNKSLSAAMGIGEGAPLRKEAR